MGARDKIVKTLVDLAKPARQVEPVGFAPGSVARLDQITQPITTWHASPYDFDTVNLSRAGTGQGANMYGHGFYSAQNPKVSGVGGEYWQEFAQHPSIEGNRLHELGSRLLQLNNFDRVKTAEDALDMADRLRSHPDAALAREITRRLESGEQVGPRVYQVDLYAKPEDYLDWYKTLELQSPQVRSGLDALENWGSGRLRGEDIYKELAQFAGGGQRGKKYATEALSDVGIPGIRYLDQKSRNAYAAQETVQDIHKEMDYLQSSLFNPSLSSQQVKDIQNKLDHLDWERGIQQGIVDNATYNYVTGNTDIIDLAKKYAVPGAAVPLGGLAAQDQYQ